MLAPWFQGFSGVMLVLGRVSDPFNGELYDLQLAESKGHGLNHLRQAFFSGKGCF